MMITYQEFKQKIETEFRFLHDEQGKEFLDFLAGQFSNYKAIVKKEKCLWRAQNGCYKEVGEMPEPYGMLRMVPDPAKVGSGRANPKGIAHLYLATHPITAIHEVRPWVGDIVSVAAFEVLQDLEIIDLSQLLDKPRHKPSSYERLNAFISKREIPPLTTEKIKENNLIEVNTAFSEPVSRDQEETEYLPTQIIAELVRREGYNGIAYRSVFSAGKEAGCNLALFEPSKAKYIDSCMCKVTSVQICVDKPVKNGWGHPCPKGFAEAFTSPDDDGVVGST